MCGIIGIFQRTGGDAQVLTNQHLEKLKHRGPDGCSLLIDGQIALGHTRLSIIDLSSLGTQPMSYANGRYKIVFNGEIYNYLELRNQLRACGERFISASDTEVILAAYHVWGADCVRHFRGMFAFALWDTKTSVLFLARDRCGERPLVYCRTSDRFYFASEIKALLPLLPSRPDLDPAVIDMYLHYQYVPEPFTLLRGVRKLPAAHTLTLRPEQWEAEPVRYWDINGSPDQPDAPRDTPIILERVLTALEDAVTLTLRSDVPVGVALSGGIDSGAIAALAQKHYPEPMHAFCVGYPGRPAHDERAQARGLADRLGMIVHEVELPVDSFVDFFPELTRIMDEPVADPAAFGHFSVPKAAHDLGIKVLLTGIGGDELFWGYPWVSGAIKHNQLIDQLKSIPGLCGLLRLRPLAYLTERCLRAPGLSPSLREVIAVVGGLGTRRTPLDQPIFYEMTTDFMMAFVLKDEVYGSAMRALSAENPFVPTAVGHYADTLPEKVIRLLFDTWLASNCLTLGDRVSMGTSVEARLPFLDVKLIETVMALRRTMPDHALGQKAWLRAALRGILPDEVLNRPKAGFTPPVWDWLCGVMERYGHIIDDGIMVDSGFLKRQAVRRIREDWKNRGWPWLFFFYKLLLLEMWHREVIA